MKTNVINVSKFKVKIDPPRTLLKKMSAADRGQLNELVKNHVEPQIINAQNQMVKEFDDHPVTKEIEAGKNTSNSSGLLDGYGNLFTFIGFDSGSSPIAIIKKLLGKRPSIVVDKTGSAGRFNINVGIASKEEIFAVTPIPWAAGRSWVDGIEKGIVGLGQYLYSNKPLSKSRSGNAVQIDNKLRGGKMRNAPYLSRIMNNFIKNLNNIK